MSKTKEVTIEQYREKLSSVCERASELTQKWLERHPGASRQEILDATYKITQAYGLAASTLAANKYDQDVALAEKQGFLKPGQIKEAEVWDPLGYGAIAKAINGTLKNNTKDKLPDTVGRMVKSFAEDTTLKNANRDGAEYAWIPAGDTCVFCLSLASNGWQRASRSTAQGNHADHIHPHCDCTFSVRFSKDTNVKGYHPEKIKAMIESQEGDTWNDKLNSMRRQMYAEKQRNAKQLSLPGAASIGSGKPVSFDENAEFKVNLPNYSESVNEQLSLSARKVAEYGSRTRCEYAAIVDLTTGMEVDFGTSEMYDSVNSYYSYLRNHLDGHFVMLHNHNTENGFSLADIQELEMWENLDAVIAVTNNGITYMVVSNGLQTNELLSMEFEDIGKDIKNYIEREEKQVMAAVEKYSEGGISIYDGRIRRNR